MEDSRETYPTVDEINALPDKVRAYIRDLETRYGGYEKAQALQQVSDERDELLERIEELEVEIKLLNHPKRIE
jgi:hypothetical protein